MEINKFDFGKRLSKFLRKMFWHFNQQPASPHSYINPKRSTSSSKNWFQKHGFKSTNKKSSIDRYYIRSQYPAIYRTCSMRERTSTLSSIPEE
jgi:hypothetical protein